MYGTNIFHNEHRVTVGQSWPGGAVECRRTIQEHRTGVTSLAYYDGLLYSGAYDGAIKVSDLWTK
jgi:hypothetical protein